MPDRDVLRSKPNALYPPGAPGAPGCSPRQQEVLKLVAIGMTNKQVARQLGIGEKTVRNYVSDIYAKLELNHRVELTLYAIRTNLIEL